MLGEFEKVYEVEFMNYTNCLRNTIWDEKSDEYIEIPDHGNTLIVKESELEEYKRFGEGYRSIKFIGYMRNVESEDKYADSN